MPDLFQGNGAKRRAPRGKEIKLVTAFHMMTDPISDMLTRIRNATMARHQSVSVPHSAIKMEMLKLLKQERFIEDFEKKGKKVRKHIVIQLKYRKDGTAAVSELRRVSKPGRRIYFKAADLHPVRQGTGVAIISTPKGLLTDKEARKAKVGGEVVCEAW